jgi:hypothetical protein
MWGLWWTKRHWGRFPPSTSVSPANHSTDFSIIIITQGWHNRPLSGQSVEWTLIPPPTMQIKKKMITIRVLHANCYFTCLFVSHSLAYTLHLALSTDHTFFLTICYLSLKTLSDLTCFNKISWKSSSTYQSVIPWWCHPSVQWIPG